MRFFVRLLSLAPAVLLGAVLAGCSPDEQGALDDEKEPHFVLGKSYVNAMDYERAVEAFKESLVSDPHSAQAHYQLACLYDTKIPDPAAAIYHYQEFLRLDPKSEIADLIHHRIDGCKQQLATDVLQLPSAPEAQQRLEKLAEKNRQMQAQIDQLNATIAALQVAAKNNPPPVPSNVSTPPANISYMPDDITGPAAGSGRNQLRITPLPPPKPKPLKARTHVVAERETMAGIARKSGVSLAALQAANPGVVPKKIRVGQTLNLP